MAAKDDGWFEAQYNARAAVPEFPEIFARGEARARRTRIDLPCYLDVPYGDGALETLDVFPAVGPSRGVLTFIHGGYWRSRDKSDFSMLARAYCPSGITLVIPNYALCPAVTIEHIIRQMLKAHAWVYRSIGAYGGNADRIVVSGHSAGGHLAAMMAACEWDEFERGLPGDLIKGAMAISGIYDLMPLRRTSMNSDLKLDENAARVASPATYLPSRPVPVITAVGAKESAEFRRQAQLLAARWSHCSRGCIVLPRTNHFTIVERFGERRGELFDALLDLFAPAA